MKTDNLTDEQFEVLGLKSGVVVAGAGAGKTRTLIAKIQADQEEIAGEPVNPADQIVVTFTNAAANEIRERLERSGAMLPGHVGTLHSLALRYVKAEWGGLTVIRDKEFDALIKATCKRTRINAPVSQVRAWIMDWPKGGNSLLLVKSIFSDMRARKIIHADVMLAAFRMILSDRPVTRNFRVYVDEAQDSSALDCSIYSNLSKSGRNKGELILFGDPRQAIYGFRGADPKHFVNAIREFGDGVVELTANFRSRPPIIELANRVAAMMGMTVKPMVSRTELVDGAFQGMAVGRGRFSSTEYEIAQLVAEVREQLQNELSVAIVTRFNMVADAAADILRAEGIAVERPGQEAAGDPAIEGLKALTTIPDDWNREFNRLSVPFALRDRLAPALASITAAEMIAPTIDEVIGMPSGDGKVWISTVHGAKGLEWDVVHLIGADDASFYAADPEDVRLAYVAVTRARLSFTWSSATSRIAERRVIGLNPSVIFH